MKKLLLLSIVSCAIMSLGFSQTMIKKNVHALQIGENNPMSICSYADPGNGGVDITWDFSSLEFSHAFTGYINNPVLTEQGASFQDANIELSEFDSRFYFNLTETQIEQVGYSSASGNSKIEYTSPFIKMKYPFAYGDSYSGVYIGEHFISGIKQSDIDGLYTIEADAYGTLILPGNTVYENTLRIRTEKNYENRFATIAQNVSIITYRWYNMTHRYPLLVLTEIITQTGDNEYVKQQAAYNNNAVNFIDEIFADEFVLFPNPVTSGNLILQFDALNAGILQLEIFDINGQLISSFDYNISEGGAQRCDLSDKISGYQPGSYMLVVKNGKDRITMNFTKLN
ncbi:MAG: T9SS type A sorting domain-containing protein [Bacteroidales bacterium]|nr:T9SS type A sorting domain-containing protein [Bacteroidales bacterium]